MAQLPEVVVTSAPQYSLGASDYVFGSLGAYSTLSEEGLEFAGYKSPRIIGIQYGVASIVSDLPGAVAGAATVAIMISQVKAGDTGGAVQNSGSGVGGIAGAEIGAGFRAAIAPPPFDVATSAVGALVGGLIGSYGGGRAAGYAYSRLGN